MKSHVCDFVGKRKFFDEHEEGLHKKRKEEFQQQQHDGDDRCVVITLDPNITSLVNFWLTNLIKSKMVTLSKSKIKWILNMNKQRDYTPIEYCSRTLTYFSKTRIFKKYFKKEPNLEILLNSIKDGSFSTLSLGRELRENREFMLKGMLLNTSLILYASMSLVNDENFILDLKKLNERDLQRVCIKLHRLIFWRGRNNIWNGMSDFEIHSRLVIDKIFTISNYSNFYTFSGRKSLQDLNQIVDDPLLPSVVERAIQENLPISEIDLYNAFRIRSSLFQKCVHRLSNEFIVAMSDLGGSFIVDIPTEMKNDIFMARKIVENDGNSLTYLSEEMKDNEEIVSIAIQSSNSDYALCYASKRLLNNREIVFTSIKCHPNSFICVDKELRESTEFILSALETLRDQENGGILMRLILSHHYSPNLRSDRKFLTEIIQRFSHNFSILKSLQHSIIGKDKELLILAANRNENVFEIMTDLASDREFILTCLPMSYKVYVNASIELKNDSEIQEKTVQYHGNYDHLILNNFSKQDFTKLLKIRLAYEFPELEPFMLNC